MTRVAAYASLVLLILMAIAYGVLRIWYPGAYQYRAELEAYLSQVTESVVNIGALKTRIHGFNLAFAANSVAFYPDKDARRPVAKLRNIEADIELLPLLMGRVQVKRLIIQSPKLLIRRNETGGIVIGWMDVETQEESGDNKLARWLFDQRLIVLRNAHLRWRDALAPENKRVTLNDADISIENIGGRHLFDLKADLGRLCPLLEASGEISGNPFAQKEEWSGAVDINVQELDLGALPYIINKWVPTDISGMISAAVHSEWSDKIPVSGKGRASLHNVVVSIPRFDGPLSIKSFDTELSWQSSEDGSNWSLNASNPKLTLAEPSFEINGPLIVSSNSDRVHIQQGSIQVNDSFSLLKRVEWDKRWFDILRNLGPAGLAQDAQLELFRNADGERDFQFSAQLEDAIIRPYAAFPGATGVSGKLVVSRYQGHATVDTHDAVVDFPRLFRSPMNIARAVGDVSWSRKGELMQLDIKNAGLENTDAEIKGEMQLDYWLDHSTSPILKLNADFNDAQLANASRYYPAGIMHEKLLDWLDSAIQGGIGREGNVTFYGPVHDFPFQHGGGKFQVNAQIEDAELEYDPAWPAIEKANLELQVKGPELLIEGDSGLIQGQSIKHVKAWIPDMKVKQKQHLYVESESSGPASEAVAFLTSGPLRGKNAKPLRGWEGEGESRLNLSLDLPLHEMSAVKVTGSCDLQDVSLKMPGSLQASGLSGKVDFTERSVSSGKIEGELMSGSANISIATVQAGKPPLVSVKGSGSMPAQALEKYLGKNITSELDGSATWQAEFKVGKQGADLSLTSNLLGIQSKLPAPLRKASKASWPLDLKLSLPAKQNGELRFSVSKRLAGFARLANNDPNESDKFNAFALAIGTDKQNAVKNGDFSLILRGAEFNIDAWRGFFNSTSEVGKGQDNSESRLNRINFQFDKVVALRRDFGSLIGEAKRSAKGVWSGHVGGPKVNGTYDISSGSAQRSVNADLKYLYWPDTLPGLKRKSQTWQPKNLPILRIHSGATHYEKMSLGAMDLKLRPGKEHWIVEQLNLKSGNMELEAHKDPETASQKVKKGVDETSLTLRVSSSNIGETMTDLGFSDQLSGGKAEIKGRIYWDGGPENYSEKALNANLGFELSDGRVLKVKPGLGRLLGALNLQSILRRLKLDFSDVFKEGFSFDKISGETNIRDGNAYFDDFVIDGPAANIALQGKIGIAARDYDLHVTVIPPLAGDASLVGFALGGPAAGVLIWLGDKVLKQPLGKLVHYQYKVTGSWDEPVVKQLTDKDENDFDGLQ